jgi:hypothetical protein
MKLKDLLNESNSSDVAYQIRSLEQYADRLAAGVTEYKSSGLNIERMSGGSFFEMLLKSSPKSRKAAGDLGWLTDAANFRRAKLTSKGKKVAPDDMRSFTKVLLTLEKEMGGADTAPKYTSQKQDLFDFIKALERAREEKEKLERMKGRR